MTDHELKHRAGSGAESAQPAEPLVSHMAAPFRTAVPMPATIARSATGVLDPLGGTEASADVTSVLRRRRGQGKALPQDTAQRFGEAYGSDLSGVRVHTDGESAHIARSVQATAFTHGADVYFSAGTYAPGSPSGDRLLAHELAHVAQHQKGEFGPAGGGTTIGRAHDPAEAAADRMAAGALSPIRRLFDPEQKTRPRSNDMMPEVTRPRSNAIIPDVDRPRSQAILPEETRARRGRGPSEELDSLKNYTGKAARVLGIEGTPDGKFSAAPSAGKREAVKDIRASETKKELHQPVADLGEIYAHNEMLNAEFQHQVAQLASVTKGKPEFRPGGKMKSVGRTMQKIVADYKGDTSRIVDITGGSIYFASADDLIAGFGAVRSNPMWKVVRVKNSLAKGKGYGDINLSLEMGGADYELEVDGKKTIEHHAGFIVELQLHLTQIIAAKAKGHKQYEAQRDIDAKYPVAEGADKDDHSKWAAEDQANWQSLEDQMMAIYGAAWDKIGGPVIGFKVREAIRPVNAK